MGSAALRASGRWSVLRLCLMPFAVSSFAALIKDDGFVLVIPPSVPERIVTIGTCAIFLLLVFAARRQVNGPPVAG